jgi:RNA polymerase sigma factor (sigma-70 family)
MTTKLDDKTLLEDLRDGKSSAYEHLYASYFGMVKYFVTHNSGTADEANDIFQEVVIVLFEKLLDPAFSIQHKVKTYLYSVSRNLWLKKLRDSKPTATIDDYENFIELEEEEDKHLTERQFNIMEKCMELLGDPCKELLTQYYYLKKNMTEIAQNMGYTNADNAKSQKYKCLKRLRKLADENA